MKPLFFGFAAVLAVSVTAPAAKAQQAAQDICGSVPSVGDLLGDPLYDSFGPPPRWCAELGERLVDWAIPVYYGLDPSPVRPSTISAELDREIPTVTAHQRTDWLNFSDADSPFSTTYRFQTECAGTTCRETSPSGRVTATDAKNGKFSGREIQWTPLGERGGITLVKRESRGTAHGTDYDWTGWGGWASDSLFFSRWREGVSGRYAGWGGAGSYSAGRASVGNPVAVTARWSGYMTGVDVGSASTRGNPVMGLANLLFDDRRGQAELDVSFISILDLEALEPRRDMFWNDLPVRNGSFAAGADSNSIQGRFYGSRHQEVAGVFERNRISGAFGATRR